MIVYDITPVPAPRQVQSDRWKQRPCVMRYRAFCDECRLKGVTVESGDNIIFILPMPPSWSKTKRIQLNGEPHTYRPDIDNLFKAVCDAVNEEDSHIWNITLTKLWGDKGQIIIERD